MLSPTQVIYLHDILSFTVIDSLDESMSWRMAYLGSDCSRFTSSLLLLSSLVPLFQTFFVVVIAYLHWTGI